MNEKQEKTETTTLTGFPDVPDNAWYTRFVLRAKDAGIMIGYDDGTFQPKEPLKRCEAATIIAKLLDYIDNATV